MRTNTGLAGELLWKKTEGARNGIVLVAINACLLLQTIIAILHMAILLQKIVNNFGIRLFHGGLIFDKEMPSETQ